MVSARRGREAPSHTPEPTDQERKDRIRAQLVAGERIATSDIQPGEFFVQMHRAILRAMNTAHRLTAGQRQYLGVLIEYSYGYRSPWAIRDMADRRPPSLADWCNWLGGWSSEQVCAVRKQLLDLRVIQYVEQNSSYVALNETWEDWDQALFTRHEKRAHAGRPAKVNPRINAQEEETSLIREFTGVNSRMSVVNPQINAYESANSPALIRGLTGGYRETVPREGGVLASNKRRNKQENNIKKREHHPYSQVLCKEKGQKSAPNTHPCQEEHPHVTLPPRASKTNDVVPRQARDPRNISQAQQLNATSQAILFPAITMPAPAQPGAAHQNPSPSRQRSRSDQERKQPPQNALYAVWEQILPPATKRQTSSLCIGLAELANPDHTLGHPVTPEELPGLMFQVMSWRRRAGGNYTPTPRFIADHLGDIRREVRENPCDRVRNWKAEQAQHHDPGETDASVVDEALETSVYGEEPGEVVQVVPGSSIEPAWLANLSHTLPTQGNTQVAWNSVVETLCSRTDWSDARQDWLRGCRAFWDAARPEELLLICRSSAQADYLARFDYQLLSHITYRTNGACKAIRTLFVPEEMIESVCVRQRRSS